ncbi:MAG: hypothetical protein DRJ97_02285 [Thermoprotei archaeon]|nr:MAG: hypothetical protein DRJ97_02285 [Thermoprotei archaeon]
MAGHGAKKVAFIGMMAALGNALFILSATVLNWGNIALDLSHVGTVIAAVYGGPLAGLTVGALVGISGGLYFGSMTGLMALYLPGFVFGKALTGLTVGCLARLFKISERRWKSWSAMAATLLGYIPECLFTVVFFLVLIPLFAPPELAGFLVTLLAPVLAKAWVEMTLIGFYMAALVGNEGFTQIIARLWPSPFVTSAVRSSSH